MKTLLVLAEHPDFAEVVRSATHPEQFRVLHRLSVEDAEPLLAHGLADACVLDLDLTGVQAVWTLEKLRRVLPKAPVLIFSGAGEGDWEEEAYLQGATQVLNKPVRPRLLSAVLERLWPAPPGPLVPLPLPAAPPSPPPSHSFETSTFGIPVAGGSSTLMVLRNFSGILSHSLDSGAMLKQFLLLLRDILGLNRAVIFLRPPLGEGVGPASESRHLRAVSAIGIGQSLLEHLELSLDGGIGGQVLRLGRILRRSSEEARHDAETQKEFELLGSQVAVPLLDRETVLGVAVFDARITGEPLTNTELELIFHLLEQLGLAIKNIWLHDQIASNQQMMAGILRELSSACVVVNRDLAILHANKTARRYFVRADRKGTDLEFADLPGELGGKVYQVLKTGAAVTNLRYEPPEDPGTVYNVAIIPFQRQAGGAPASALLMAEDLTQTEQLRRLEVETANLRLIKSMADRLTHEIGNAMVPLSTHQQLLADKWKDPEFRSSLDLALADGVKRVTRLLNQMRFLSRDTMSSNEAFPIAPLIEEAYQEACKYQPAKSAQLRYEHSSKPIILNGDRAALKHAFTEVMLNALQANPGEPKIGVRMHADPKGEPGRAVQIEVQDNGAGFSAEALQHVPAPFFSTRNVGLGLGLTVSRKIVETHRGKLEIIPAKSGTAAGVVRISLPLEAPVTIQE